MDGCTNGKFPPLYCKDKFENLEIRMKEKTDFIVAEVETMAALGKEIELLKKQSDENKKELNTKIDTLRKDMNDGMKELQEHMCESISEIKDGMKKTNTLLVTMLVSIVLSVIGLLLDKII